MCVTIPRQVVRVWGDRAEVLIDGRPREVLCVGLAGLQPGDYVLLHANVVIERLSAAEAQAALDFLAALGTALDDPDGVDQLLAFMAPASAGGR